MPKKTLHSLHKACRALFMRGLLVETPDGHAGRCARPGATQPAVTLLFLSGLTLQARHMPPGPFMSAWETPHRPESASWPEMLCVHRSLPRMGSRASLRSCSGGDVQDRRPPSRRPQGRSLGQRSLGAVRPGCPGFEPLLAASCCTHDAKWSSFRGLIFHIREVGIMRPASQCQ